MTAMETGARYTLVGLFTLAAIMAGFAFVYWLHNVGGVGERSAYQVRFEDGVSGLRAGSGVLFNGMRVGEVTALRLSATHPRAVVATIAIDRGTPVRADTEVSVETQGLMGAPSVVLKGGQASSPPKPEAAGGPPLLVADAGASQDTMATARTVLRRIDGILVENAEPLRTTLANLKIFTDALARNSDKLETIVAGIERMTGGGPAATPPTLFDLAAPSDFAPVEKPPAAQLVVADPTAVVALETQRLLTGTPGGETGAFADAQWSDTLPRLFQSRILQSFENAGYKTVNRPFESLTVDVQLLVDLRAFRILRGDETTAEVAFGAKLVGSDGKIVDARLFRVTAPAPAATDAKGAAAALNQTFARAMHELVPWTLGKL